MKLRMKSVQNPVWKAMWKRTRPVVVLYNPRFTVMSRTGTMRIWNGTKLPATKRKKIASTACHFSFSRCSPQSLTARANSTRWTSGCSTRPRHRTDTSRARNGR